MKKQIATCLKCGGEVLCYKPTHWFHWNPLWHNHHEIILETRDITFWAGTQDFNSDPEYIRIKVEAIVDVYHNFPVQGVS